MGREGGGVEGAWRWRVRGERGGEVRKVDWRKARRVAIGVIVVGVQVGPVRWRRERGDKAGVKRRQRGVEEEGREEEACVEQ